MRAKSYLVALTGALIALTALMADAWAQRRPDFDRSRGELVLLGEKQVGFLVDRDVIRVNQPEDWFRERAFTALRFQAERNDIHMISIRVVYLNGYAEDFRVDQLIRQGADLRVDLRGDRSYIRQIEMVYRSRPDFRGQALLRVFGEPARRPVPPPDSRPGRGNLVLLGEKAVGFLVDRDVIRVGQSEDWFRERAFTALHFEAERNDIHMISIRVVYINGYAEDFRVDQLIRQGSDLRVDLRGDRSYIRQIEMVYRSRPNFRGQAHIRVYGEPARRPGPVPGPIANWVELGCQSVSFLGRDRDVIRVGRREGRFRAIRLRVRGTDVEFLDVRVVYGNGEPDSIPVRRIVRAGDDTGPLDLRGRDRFIDRIELAYRARPNFRGTATVCADGRD
jgi:hypothetical protein